MLEFISVTLVSALLVLCGLAGTTRVVSVADGIQQSKSTSAEPAKAPAAPKAMLEWTGIPKVSLENPTLHRGIVLGPDGHPLPGASIYAASTIELLEISKADKAGVKDNTAKPKEDSFEVSGDFAALFQESNGGLAFFRFGFPAKGFENLVEFFDMAFRLLEMGLDQFLQMFAGGSFDHLRHRQDESFLGVITVRQFFQE